jgi:asparagine synthase (glutamine-hydrolysing)
LLRDTDVMSMAHSLEVRVPLLDHRLVEAVLRLPGWVQRNGRGPKALLVDALGPDLPPMIRERHDKRGFAFPLDFWLRRGLEISPILLSENSRFKSKLLTSAIGYVLEAYWNGRMHWSRLWALGILTGWAAANAVGL